MHFLRRCSTCLVALALLAPSTTRAQFDEGIYAITDTTPAKQIGATTWTQRTETADWTPRSLHACVNWFGQGVFVLGGFNGKRAHGDLADVWLLPANATDDASVRQAWHQLTPSSGFSPRHGHSVAVWEHPTIKTGKFLIATGGTGGGPPLAEGADVYGHHGGAFFGDFWRSPDGIDWNPESAQFPGRSGHTMVVLDDQDLVLMGGISGGLILNDIWCMGPKCEMKAEDWLSSGNCRDSWCRVTQQAPWDAREDAAAGIVPTMLRGQPSFAIVFCGGLGPSQAYNDVWYSTDGGEAWTLLSKKAAWAPRGGHAIAVTTGSQVVLFGGTYGGSYMSDVWVSLDAGISWSMLTSAAPFSPRASHCVVTTAKGILLIGGFDGENDLSDVWSGDFTLTDGAISMWFSPMIIATFVSLLDF